MCIILFRTINVKPGRGRGRCWSGEGFGLKPKTFVKCLGVGYQLSVTSVKYSINNNNYTLILHWLQDYNFELT